eukprot:3891520-Rhodomonas_salina.2
MMLRRCSDCSPTGASRSVPGGSPTGAASTASCDSSPNWRIRMHRSLLRQYRAAVGRQERAPVGRTCASARCLSLIHI